MRSNRIPRIGVFLGTPVLFNFFTFWFLSEPLSRIFTTVSRPMPAGALHLCLAFLNKKILPTSQLFWRTLSMKSTWIMLAMCITFALVSTVSASPVKPVNGPASITFSYEGNLVVTLVSSSAGYNNEFGTFSPVTKKLGFINDPKPADGSQYTEVGRCSDGVQVVLYITTPGKPTDPHGPQMYRSDIKGGEPVPQPHADVFPQSDGSYTVGFEDLWGGGDRDYNDVVLNVACTPDPIVTNPDDPSTPVPEFPTMALPAGLIMGLLGAVLFIQRIKEN
jgi:hypothetical protein